MTNAAERIITVLLGWMKIAAGWLWNGLSSEGGFFSWLASAWLPIVVILCAAGTVIDLVVYLFRWQPVRVWKSFFRRLRERPVGDEEMTVSLHEESVQPVVPAEEVPADSDAPVSDTPAQRPRRMDRHLQKKSFRLRQRLVEAAMGNSTDEATLLDTYRPVMNQTDKSEAFRAPAFPEGWQEEHKSDA